MLDSTGIIRIRSLDSVSRYIRSMHSVNMFSRYVRLVTISSVHVVSKFVWYIRSIHSVGTPLSTLLVSTQSVPSVGTIRSILSVSARSVHSVGTLRLIISESTRSVHSVGTFDRRMSSAKAVSTCCRHMRSVHLIQYIPIYTTCGWCIRSVQSCGLVWYGSVRFGSVSLAERRQIMT